MVFSKSLSRLSSCQHGTVAIIFAIVLIPFLLIVGAAVDYSRASSAKAAIQEQLDSAILAGTTYETTEPKEKADFALKHFYAVMPDYLKAYIGDGLAVELTAGGEGLRGTLHAVVPTEFMHVLGWDAMRATLVSAADIKIRNRQLDMVFCIDATGSMQEEIDGVTNAAYSLEDRINQKLKEKDKTPYDAMRVRVIFYRDFASDRGMLDRDSPPRAEIDFADPSFEDKIPPMNRSDYGRFWTLPQQRSSFKNFLDSEHANGGGATDEPEAGFVCLNEALESDWAKKGDALASDPSKTITSVTPLIAIWTDANARPIDDPHAQHLPRPQPRSYDELKAKWDDATRLDQKNKLLLFFGDLDRACATDEEKHPVAVASASADETGSLAAAYEVCPQGGVPRWHESIGEWGMGKDVFNYSLHSATSDPASRIADALLQQPNLPRLTQ